MSELEKIGTIANREVLTYIWRMYRRQKDAEAEAGVDTAADMNRMRAWFQHAAQGKSTPEELERRFPDEPSNEGRSEGSYEDCPDCPDCRGTGIYFSRSTKKSRLRRAGGREVTEVQGVVTCTCVAGHRKLEAIKNLGKPKKKKSRRFGG